jgi:hypothetical protein
MGAGLLLGMLLAPAGASGAVNCARTGAVLDVGLTAAGDQAHLAIDGGAIEVRSKTFSQVLCANAPTVSNVDTVNLVDSSGGNTLFSIDDVDAYGPGASAAGGDAGAATDEIEFVVTQGAGGGDELALRASSGGATIAWGTLGINPNATGAENTPDADITQTGVEINSATGGFGAQSFSGAGGAGTGSPFTRPLRLSGGFDDDLIEGGNGDDELDGSFDDDTLRGGAGDDEVGGSFGADDVSGGAGVDTAAYRISCVSDEDDCSVKVNLADDGFVDGGTADESDVTPGKRDDVGSDVENILGGADDDTLIGNGARNVLEGRLGRDRLFGKGGRDLLLTREFVQDLALNCGKGKRDRVTRDRFDPRGKGCELPRRKRKKNRR